MVIVGMMMRGLIVEGSWWTEILLMLDWLTLKVHHFLITVIELRFWLRLEALSTTGL